MSKLSQPQRQSRLRPAGAKTGGKTPARSSGGIGLPSSRRGRLSILALVLALAALVLVPAVILAAAPEDAPSGLKATSGDGTMKLSWGTLTGAGGGYDFRYAGNVAALFTATWHDVPGDNDEITTK